MKRKDQITLLAAEGLSDKEISAALLAGGKPPLWGEEDALTLEVRCVQERRWALLRAEIAPSLMTPVEEYKLRRAVQARRPENRPCSLCGRPTEFGADGPESAHAAGYTHD